MSESAPEVQPGEVEIRGGDKPSDYIKEPPGTWHLTADALDELDDDVDSDC